METIRQDIKQNSLRHVYLLYGDEQLVVKLYRNKLLKALMGTDSLEELKQDMNFSFFVDPPLNVEDVIAMAVSFPFLSEKRVILIENSKIFAKENKALVDCIKNLPETTYIIFTEIVKPEKKSLYKAIGEIGHIAEINKQEQGFVEQWVIRNIMDSGKRISRGALDMLLERTESDMMRISNEIDKLVAYKGDEQDIKVEDVSTIVKENPKSQVFKMIDAISEKNVDLAMKYYFDMLELKESPQDILRLIERQMRILFQVKDLRDKGFDIKTIASSVKEVNEYYANKYIRQASKFSMEEIMSCLADCVDLNLESRTGALTDRMAVELIIVKYSKKNEQKRA